MIRTRFAPSPTGFLHIGGVRTALFNWLYAHQHDGRYVLRIDDTDQLRNVEAALNPILDGFRWLDLNWDEGPQREGQQSYFQSQRGHRYQAAVDRLLASGHAYRDYSRTEELEAERNAARAAGLQFSYSRQFAGDTAEKRAAFEAEGRPGVVRLKMPREGELTIHDLVRGDVVFPWAQEADHVIQRADGSFIYHLANVVDDEDFGISHVLRAEEHLPNTPRQIFMIHALGYRLPAYGHLPYVAEPGSKRKLSKRKLDAYLKNADFAAAHHHGQKIAAALKLDYTPETFNPVCVDFYAQVGYLPHALVNYLLLLGWSLDGSTEFFTRDEMLKHFSLERIHGAPASFDPAKLLAVQKHWFAQLSLEEKLNGCWPFLTQAGLVAADADTAVRERIARIIELLGDRLAVFGDLVLQAPMLLKAELHERDEAAFAKHLAAAEPRALLAAYAEWLPQAPFDSAASLEAASKQWLADRGGSPKQMLLPLRLAITGQTSGPGLFDCVVFLGVDVARQRIAAVA
jgi:glutamyl-tRNA synthetase